MKIARKWDQLPPTVYDGDEAIGTRLLELKYRKMTSVAEALLEYIDAIPEDVVLPTMPGVDRDWVDEVLADKA